MLMSRNCRLSRECGRSGLHVARTIPGFGAASAWIRGRRKPSPDGQARRGNASQVRQSVRQRNRRYRCGVGERGHQRQYWLLHDGQQPLVPYRVQSPLTRVPKSREDRCPDRHVPGRPQLFRVFRQGGRDHDARGVGCGRHARRDLVCEACFSRSRRKNWRDPPEAVKPMDILGREPVHPTGRGNRPVTAQRTSIDHCMRFRKLAIDQRGKSGHRRTIDVAAAPALQKAKVEKRNAQCWASVEVDVPARSCRRPAQSSAQARRRRRQQVVRGAERFGAVTVQKASSPRPGGSLEEPARVIVPGRQGPELYSRLRPALWATGTRGASSIRVHRRDAAMDRRAEGQCGPPAGRKDHRFVPSPPPLSWQRRSHVSHRLICLCSRRCIRARRAGRLTIG